MTSSTSAWAPASTGSAVPSSTNPLPSRDAVTGTGRGADRRPDPAGFASAHAAMVSPAHSPGRRSACCAGVPERASAAATTLTGRSGPGATCAPKISASAARSVTPAPVIAPPPNAAGTSSEVQPSSAPRRQKSRSKPVSERRERPDRRERAFTAEELPRRGAEQLLVLGDDDVHGQSCTISSARSVRPVQSGSSTPRLSRSRTVPSWIDARRRTEPDATSSGAIVPASTTVK